MQLNPQIDTANRVLGRDATLAAASLPASQHRYYANAAAWWRKHRDALIHERNTMGAWRAQLGASDRAISTWITAAGSSRSLAPSVARWKKQRAWQAYEIAVISHMLGPTAAQVAAAARAHPAPKPAPGPTASQVSAQGTAFLKAWQTRHGGGFGAAWGPTPVNPQIDNMTAAQKRSATLAAAPGLTAAQRKAWTATAADQKKRITALTAELGIMRSWRNLLISNDNTLTADIAAAGNNASLRGNVAGWKTQLARQKTTINTISAMLGLSAAQIAAAQKAGTLGPGGAPLPAVTHSYGGDVAGTIGATLAAALGPFTATPTLMDRGGTLKPGLSTVYNATGRPEQLIPARGGGGGTLQVEWVGGNGGDDLERWIKKNVKIRGGGDVQRAWGSRLFTPVAPLLNPRVPRSV